MQFLLDDGWSCVKVGKALYLDDDTIRIWHKHFQSGGLDELTMFDWKVGLSFLNAAQQVDLSDWLEGRLCRDTREIRAYIETTFGVHYSHSGCLKLLHRLAARQGMFTCLRVGVRVQETQGPAACGG
jgi:transposase